MTTTTAPRANPLPEFDQEMSVTRRLLERVPTDRGEWRPHAKSFPLGHLAQLVARMPGWLPAMLREPHIDLASSRGYSFEPTEALLAEFDANVSAARVALDSATAADLEGSWSLRHGENVLLTQSRGTAVRTHLHHMIHHRAQLGVYLRLNDIPVPSMYGPTADERW
ncbi:MAG: DinB family protein [Gemmatimonadaceae bacterium]